MNPNLHICHRKNNVCDLCEHPPPCPAAAENDLFTSVRGAFLVEMQNQTHCWNHFFFSPPQKKRARLEEDGVIIAGVHPGDPLNAPLSGTRDGIMPS